MHVLWTSHIKDEEEKEEFRKYVGNSTSLLDRLSDIIRTKIQAAEAARLSKMGYTSPSWALEQADHIGYLRAWHEILSLTQRKD